MGRRRSGHCPGARTRGVTAGGSLFWINLGATSPPELGKIRPGVIVFSTAANETLDSVVVVPLSTIGSEIWPLRIRTDNVRGKAAFAILPGIRQVSKARLTGFIGVASSSFMKRLDAAIDIYLGD